MIFYDIESLDNVFTCACFDDVKNISTIYYLVDSDELISENCWQDCARDTIYKNNLNFSGTIVFKDLADVSVIKEFAKLFGLETGREEESSEYRLVRTTDAEYDPNKHPFLLGYNSYNYDTTMLALFLNSCYQPKIQNGRITKEYVFSKTTAKEMRKFNDDLFAPQWKKHMYAYLASVNGDPLRKNYSSPHYNMRKNMLLSGRHLDVAKLNEKQQKVGLKRLLGMLGCQIKESDKLQQGQSQIHTPEQFYDLLAYNISDIVNLKVLFNHQTYQAQFKLKKQLLQTYPELVYEQKANSYEPNISPTTVKKNRLNIDSSSAQFATSCLCPYGHLKDIDVVSFNYPSEEIAKELGIERKNILEECKKFFYALYHDKPEVLKQFDTVYDFYKSIEGKNFNDSNAYREDRKDIFDYYNVEYDDMIGEHLSAIDAMLGLDCTSLNSLFPATMALPENLRVYKLNEIPKKETFLPYFDKDGKPTSCYVIFSTGGVHGAEYNKKLYDRHMAEYNQLKKDFNEVMGKYPNPIDLRKAKTVVMDDGRELSYKVFLKSAKIADSQYKDISSLEPKLYEMDAKKGPKLNKKYSFTSADYANHEDFTSYYPNLLRMMGAFYNEGLGYDRYAEIFNKKEEYGKQMKDKSLSEQERQMASILREGTKLILNSASGAADALFENNIRVNNQIISMRIIGQLFSWRIGQAQAYKGAKMISTNTDGLYSVMEKTINNKILEAESADIGVDIEPEPLYLISKDTNNRIELTEDMRVIGASGSTVGCRKGPTPTKALSHPALIDWALAEYLIAVSNHKNDLDLSKPFDRDLGLEILKSARKEFTPLNFLKLAQNIIAASIASDTYPCATVNIDDPTEEPIPLQHYNRIFFVKDGTPSSIHLKSVTAKKITPATVKKRKKEGIADQQHNIQALRLIKKYGVIDIPHTHEVVFQKITNIEPEWSIFIYNKDLSLLVQDENSLNKLINSLDYEHYLDLVQKAYENSWKNQLPQEE